MLRILVEFDGANLVGQARCVNRKVDLLKLREFLASPEEGRLPVEVIAYLPMPPNGTAATLGTDGSFSEEGKDGCMSGISVTVDGILVESCKRRLAMFPRTA